MLVLHASALSLVMYCIITVKIAKAQWCTLCHFKLICYVNRAVTKGVWAGIISHFLVDKRKIDSNRVFKKSQYQAKLISYLKLIQLNLPPTFFEIINDNTTMPTSKFSCHLLENLQWASTNSTVLLSKMSSMLTWQVMVLIVTSPATLQTAYPFHSVVMCCHSVVLWFVSVRTASLICHLLGPP